MVVIDVLGQPCPIPVVKARKAIEGILPEGGSVQVIVDNTVSCENLGKMADHHGFTHTLQQREDGNYAVTITVAPGQTIAEDYLPATMPSSDAGLVVAIGRDGMGHGSDELSKILIKGFIFSLSQLNVPPKAILFFNAGVQLTIATANTLDDLKALEQKGTLIRVCGTCVDYYGCKEQVAVGEITNMYGIVEMMSGAQTVINL